MDADRFCYFAPPSLFLLPPFLYLRWQRYLRQGIFSRLFLEDEANRPSPAAEPLDVPSNQHAIHGAPPPTYGTTYGTA
jgi:hypothetical protein